MQIFIWNSHFELFVNFQTCTKGLWFYSVFDWFFWLKFNWAHVNWSTSHEPTKNLCTFLNWNLSSFSLLFLSPLISFVYFDFYWTLLFGLIAHIFLSSLNEVQWSVFKCTDTWGVIGGKEILDLIRETTPSSICIINDAPLGGECIEQPRTIISRIRASISFIS